MKRILSLLLALIMIVGTITPVMARTVVEGEVSQPDGGLVKPGTVQPGLVKVVVHKVLMNKNDLDTYKGKKEDEKKYDPSKGIQNIAQHFGNSAKPIKGVYFIALQWNQDEDETTNFNNSRNQLDNEFFTQYEQEGKAGLTGDDGSITFNLTYDPNEETVYNIYEVKDKSTYKSDKDKILAEQLAVPIRLEFPKHALTADGYAGTIHVYPKNTEDGPEVEKFVKVGDEDKNLATFDKTEEHTWAIEATIPAGIEDYKLFTLEDKLENSLSYVKNQEVSVKIKGDKGATSTTTLTKNVDYTVTAPTEDKGGTLTVALTEAGIKKLKAYVGKKVRVEFKTTINDDAVMSKDIPNDVTLKYGHKPDSKLTKSPKDKPKVYTGGKKFKKIDSSQSNKALQGAEFVIKNGKGKYLFEENGKYVWKAVTETDPKKIGEETNIKKITSGQDGTFEITGLKYDRTNGTKYSLVEVKAPKDYALLTSPVNFTVNDTSYYKDVKQVQLEAADPQNVDNKPITIPQTGGIGTVIFTVVGVALMAGAVVAMRKNKEA